MGRAYATTPEAHAKTHIPVFELVLPKTNTIHVMLMHVCSIVLIISRVARTASHLGADCFSKEQILPPADNARAVAARAGPPAARQAALREAVGARGVFVVGAVDMVEHVVVKVFALDGQLGTVEAAAVVGMS